MAPACPAGIARKNQGAQQPEAAGAAEGVAKAGEEAAEVAEKTTALAPAAAAIAKQLKVAAKPVTDAVVLSKGNLSEVVGGVEHAKADYGRDLADRVCRQ